MKHVILIRHADILASIVPLITDLADEMPAELRYTRLLASLRRILPCDAVTLLRLDGDTLVPLATHGLSADTLGRRFRVADHPRLHAILETPRALLFPPDSDLPDPYDGLVQANKPHLEVHDCMGCTLRVGQAVWGMLTLDALEAGRFSAQDLDVLDTFASLAAAMVATNARFYDLTRSVQDERRRVEAYHQALAQPSVLTGHSPAFRQLTTEIDLVAPSDLSVLITGETGVGKELVARRLHALSGRAKHALISVNCAALPDNLVESELFGHVRGAFSGAVSERLGKFEMAHGGTLFLDEIGELPLTAQAKLLRVVQDGQLQRVGSDRAHHADVRLIAATNRNLAEEVRAGRFRADLYHRISVYPMRVPPLRERGRDVLLLAGTFIEENRRRMGLRGLRLAHAAHTALLAHDWPGNVRELEYLIARSTLKATGRQVSASRPASLAIVTLQAMDLDIVTEAAAAPTSETAPELYCPTDTHTDNLRTQVRAYERQLISAALGASRGNVAAAARRLGLDRGNLVRLARRLEMDLTQKATLPQRQPFKRQPFN